MGPVRQTGRSVRCTKGVLTPRTGSVPAYVTEVLADNPILYWKMWEASGSQAADSSGNNYHGTFINTPTLGVTGPYTGGLATSFAGGSSEYVQRSGGENFAQRPMSIDAWVNTPGTERIVVFDQRGVSDGVVFLIEPDGTMNLTAYGVATWTSGTGDMIEGVWTHVAVTVASGGAITWYVNGSSVGTSTATSISSSTSVIYSNAKGGSGGVGVEDIATVEISDVAVYDTELSGTRVLAHYDAV